MNSETLKLDNEISESPFTDPNEPSDPSVPEPPIPEPSPENLNPYPVTNPVPESHPEPSPFKMNFIALASISYNFMNRSLSAGKIFSTFFLLGLFGATVSGQINQFNQIFDY